MNRERRDKPIMLMTYHHRAIIAFCLGDNLSSRDAEVNAVHFSTCVLQKNTVRRTVDCQVLTQRKRLSPFASHFGSDFDYCW